MKFIIVCLLSLASFTSFAQHGRKTAQEDLANRLEFPKEVWDNTYRVSECLCDGTVIDCGLVKNTTATFGADTISMVSTSPDGLTNHIETSILTAPGKAKQISELSIQRKDCKDQTPYIDFDSAYIGGAAEKAFSIIPGKKGEVSVKTSNEDMCPKATLEVRYKQVPSSRKQ
jgi:hypothetical protein